MTFHIAEVFGLDLDITPEVSNDDLDSGDYKVDSLEDVSLEMIVGWHCEKERLVVWIDGLDTFGFTWFDRLTGDDGFTTASAVNFDRDCVLCDKDVPEDSRIDSSKVMAFLDHEVNEYPVEEVDIEYEDVVGGDGRVWKISTGRMRYEDIISQYVCEGCGDTVIDGIDEVAESIPEEIVLRSL